MTLPPKTKALADTLAATLLPEHVVRRAIRTDLAITDDGRTRANMMTGELSRYVLPAFALDQIEAPEGTGFDDLAAFLDGLGVAYAPIGAKYIVQQSDGSLTNEQSLGALATGIVLVTTTTGVLSSTPTLSNYLATSGALQGSADTASTSSTTIYSIAIDDDITLATGTWSIWSIGFVNLRNTAASSNDVKITVDGTDSTIITRAFGSANPSAAQVLIGSKASITGGAAKTVAVKYKASTTGTAEAFSCGIFSYAMRTA